MDIMTIDNIERIEGSTETEVVPMTVSKLGTGEGEPQDTNIRGWVVTIFVLGLALMSWLAWLLWQRTDPKDFVPNASYASLAGIVIFAQAVERLLEPFSQWLMPADKEKREASESFAQADEKAKNPDVASTEVRRSLKAAAKKAAVLKRRRAERAIAHWAVASTVALMGSALLGFFILRSVAIPDIAPNRFIDLVVTGLVIGAGTKPLHDLISGVQSKKESAEASI